MPQVPGMFLHNIFSKSSGSEKKMFHRILGIEYDQFSVWKKHVDGAKYIVSKTFQQL